MRRLAIAWLGLALLPLALVAANPLPAAAHAQLTDASTAAGSVLPTVPETITLAFSEAIEGSFSAAAILDSAGASAGNVAVEAMGVETVTLRLPPGLPPGQYMVTWRVLSAVDGHVTAGAIPFSAGTGQAATTATTQSQDVPLWRVGVRWLELMPLLLATGTMLFYAVVAPASSLERVRTTLTPRIGLVGLVALVGLVVAIIDQTLAASGTSLRNPPSAGLFLDLLRFSDAGRWWLARLAATAVMFAFAITWAGSNTDERRDRLNALMAAAAGVAAFVTLAGSGHAAAAGRSMLAIANDTVHLTMAAVWGGGLAVLTLLLWRRGRTVESDSRDSSLLRRFSLVALGTFLLLLVTGTLNAVVNVDGQRALRGEDYGVTVLVKHLLIVPVVIAAAVNLLVARPRLGDSHGTNDGERIRRATAHLRWLVLAELVLVGGIVTASAALAELPPANAPLAVQVAPKIVTIRTGATAGNLTVDLLSRLAGEAGDRYTIGIRDGDGKPVGDIQRVIIRSSTMLAGSTDSIGDRFDAERSIGSPATYFFPSTRLGVPGQWNVEITVRRANLDDQTVQLAFDTSNAGARPPRAVSDNWQRLQFPTLGVVYGVLAVLFAVGGIVLIRKLGGIEPLAAMVVLTMTALIAGGLAVSSYRSAAPVTPGNGLAAPAADADSISRGSSLYAANCLLCHGADGKGPQNPDDPVHGHGSGVNLRSIRARTATNGDLFWWVSAGVPGSSMPAYDWSFTETERWDVVAYLRAIQSGTVPTGN